MHGMPHNWTPSGCTPNGESTFVPRPECIDTRSTKDVSVCGAHQPYAHSYTGS